MYVIAAIAVGALLSAPVAGVLHGVGHRLIAALWLAPLVSLLLTGALGGLEGRALMHEAIASAAPDQTQMIVASAVSIQLYTDAFCRVLLVGLGLLLGTFVTIGHLVGTRGERGRWSHGPGIGAGVIVLLGSGLALAMGGWRVAQYGSPLSLLAGAIAFPAALGILAVGLRRDHEDHRIGGTAGARLVVWGAAVIAVWAAAGLPTTSGLVIAFKAVASAAPEHRAELLRTGFEVARADGGPGLWAVAGLLLAAPLLLIPCGAALRRVAGVLGAAAAGLLLLVAAGSALMTVVWQGDSLALLADMGLPEEINRARIDCRERVSQPGVYEVSAKAHQDGSLTELRVSLVDGTPSQPAMDCLRERLADLRLEDQGAAWGGYDPGYEVPAWDVRWTFEMPPPDRVQSLLDR